MRTTRHVQPLLHNGWTCRVVRVLPHCGTRCVTCTVLLLLLFSMTQILSLALFAEQIHFHRVADQVDTEVTECTPLDRQPPHLPTIICYTSALAYCPTLRTSRLAIFHSNVGNNNHVLFFAKLVFKIGGPPKRLQSCN